MDMAYQNIVSFHTQREQENKNNVNLTIYYIILMNLCHFLVMIKISISDDLRMTLYIILRISLSN